MRQEGEHWDYGSTTTTTLNTKIMIALFQPICQVIHFDDGDVTAGCHATSDCISGCDDEAGICVDCIAPQCSSKFPILDSSSRM